MVDQEAVAAAPGFALSVLSAGGVGCVDPSGGRLLRALRSGVLAEAQHTDVHEVALSALAVVAEADGLTVRCPVGPLL